jgi:hypothetical protein
MSKWEGNSLLDVSSEFPHKKYKIEKEGFEIFEKLRHPLSSLHMKYR